MHKIEKDCLVDFFDSINNKFEYVIMRNAEELPFDNFSNDIDILIDEKSFFVFEDAMRNLFKKHDFNRVERTSFHGIECYTFYNIKQETPYSLKIDLFFNIEGGGVRYFDGVDVLKYKVKNKNGLYVFNVNVESYLTALKTLAAGGKLKEKYLNNFLSNPIDSNHDLIKKCPSVTLNSYLKNIYKEKENLKEISRKKIIKETIVNNLKHAPLKTLKRIIYHYGIEIFRLFKKNYMMVLVGPDGSGKTTLIEKIKNDSKITFRSLPERFTVFHHRPHVLPNISQIFNKKMNEEEVYDLNFNPHSGKTSNYVVSFVKLLYYALDYIFGYFIKIMPLQRENKFVVFDRYFFDFIVDQKRSALKVPRSIAICIYKLMIPKPNKVFFIKVEPQEAHDRKKELSVKMIEEINNNYDYLSQQLKCFVIIPNEDLNKAYNDFLKNVILVITDEAK